jgi:hypothetical protein
MTADIAALDTPLPQVERQAVLLAAEALTHSPSDLVTHPDAPVSTAADYPNWTPGGAA